MILPDQAPSPEQAGCGQTRWTLSERVRLRAVVDEGLLVHLDRGRVIVVNVLGLEIARRLNGAAVDRQALIDEIAGEYASDAETIGRDLDVFLGALQAEGLIQAVAADAAPGSAR